MGRRWRGLVSRAIRAAASATRSPACRSSRHRSSYSIWQASVSDLRPNCMCLSLAMSSFRCAISCSRDLRSSCSVAGCACCRCKTSSSANSNVLRASMSSGIRRMGCCVLDYSAGESPSRIGIADRSSVVCRDTTLYSSTACLKKCPAWIHCLRKCTVILLNRR